MHKLLLNVDNVTVCQFDNYFQIQSRLHCVPAGSHSLIHTFNHSIIPQGGVIIPCGSHRSSQLWLSFQRNTCPLIRREFLSIPAICVISSSLRKSLVTASRLLFNFSGFTEKGIGTCPRCTAHLRQTSAGCIRWFSAIFTITGSSISTVSCSVRSLSGRLGEPIGLNPMGWIPLLIENLKSSGCCVSRCTLHQKEIFPSEM